MLLKVCLLGGGTFIGDMSLDGSRRAATVIALHAVVTYKYCGAIQQPELSEYFVIQFLSEKLLILRMISIF